MPATQLAPVELASSVGRRRYAGGVDVGDLLVEEPLAGADVADARQQLIEVTLPESAARFDALVVEGEAFDQQLAEPGSGPLAELSAARRPDPVADGQNHAEAVVLQRPPDLPAAFRLN